MPTPKIYFTQPQLHINTKNTLILFPR